MRKDDIVHWDTVLMIRDAARETNPNFEYKTWIRLLPIPMPKENIRQDRYQAMNE